MGSVLKRMWEVQPSKRFLSGEQRMEVDNEGWFMFL